MSAPRIHAVADPLVVPAGTTAGDAVAAAGLATRARGRWLVRDPSGRLRDLDWTPELDTDVTPVPLDSPDGLNVLRHSTAHVLARAVQDTFPEAKLGIGPPIENGFYYDFDVAKPFQPDDLTKLERRMQEIVKAGSGSAAAATNRSTRPRSSWPTSRTSWSRRSQGRSGRR